MKFIKYFFRKKNVRKYFLVSNSFIYNKIYSMNNVNNNNIQYINNLPHANNNVQQLNNNILQINNINMRANCNITKKILIRNKENVIVKIYLESCNIESISREIVDNIYDFYNFTFELYARYRDTGHLYATEINPVEGYENFYSIMKEIYTEIDN